MKKRGRYERNAGTIWSKKLHDLATDSFPALDVSYKYKDIFCG
jgi:hypothetical protein